MPRSMYELCGITENDFKAYMEKYKTCGRVAKVLGVSRKTVNTYAKALGLTIPPHRPKSNGHPTMLHSNGQIVKWVKEHPDTKLPTKAAEIARLVGCSRGAAYSFINWRHKRWLEYLRKFPQIPETTKLTDTHRRPLDFRFVQSYTLDFDVIKMKVVINAKLGKAASTVVEMTVKDFEQLFTL